MTPLTLRDLTITMHILIPTEKDMTQQATLQIAEVFIMKISTVCILLTAMQKHISPRTWLVLWNMI